MAGAATAVEGIRERETQHDVDRPRVHAPVQEGLRHRLLREFGGSALHAGAGRDEALVDIAGFDG